MIKTRVRLLRFVSLNFYFIGLLGGFFCDNGFGETAATDDLQKQIALIAETAKGKVGVAAKLLETSETVQWNGQKSFPMQSVYKLPIGMAVLHQVDQGTLRLEQLIRFTTNDYVGKMQHSPLRDAYPHGAELSVSNLLQRMVSESDGSACDILLRVLGGPATVANYLRAAGLTHVMVATTEKEMGSDELAQYRSRATPAGFIELLQMLQSGHELSASSRELLFRFLTETSTGPNRIKGNLPVGTRVAHKTGSSRTINQLTRATNDAGIITLPDGRHVAIAVFISDSTADDATREGVIAKISRAVWDHWVKAAPQAKP